MFFSFLKRLKKEYKQMNGMNGMIWDEWDESVQKWCVKQDIQLEVKNCTSYYSRKNVAENVAENVQVDCNCSHGRRTISHRTISRTRYIETIAALVLIQFAEETQLVESKIFLLTSRIVACKSASVSLTKRSSSLAVFVVSVELR